jgi:hypothetical protein
MKRFSTLLPTLALLSVLAACGGGEAPPADDTDTGAAPQTAPPPAASTGGGGLSCTLQGATPQEASQRPSPHRSLAFNLGPNPALLCYGAPSARGREIMGGLVPYGEPWRMGADEPTTLHLSSRANVGGVALQPGSYSIYAIPREGQWEIFVNSNVGRWGIPIDAAVRSTELGSFMVTPQPLPEMVETLTYEFEEAAGGEPGGELLMEWERTLIRIPIEA